MRINFRHSLDFLSDKVSQFLWFDNLDLGPMAEDDLDQFAEIGGREGEQQAAVRVFSCFLLGTPDLFGQPGRDLRGKVRGHRKRLVALHDAEMSAGVFLDGREIGGQSDRFEGWCNRSDACKSEVPNLLPVRAPGQQMPAAHIVHEMKRLDGPA